MAKARKRKARRPHRKARRHKARTFSLSALTLNQQIAILAVIGVVIFAILISGGFTQLGAPAGQQFAPVIGQPDGCSDSDGIDFSTPGSVVNVLDGGRKDFTDYCASTETLGEYYCSGNVADIVLVDCPSGCNLGRCV